MQIDECENVFQSKQSPHFKWKFQLFVGGGGNGFDFMAMFIHRTTSSIKKIFKTLNGITIITIAIQYFTLKFEVIFSESKKQARNIVWKNKSSSHEDLLSWETHWQFKP